MGFKLICRVSFVPQKLSRHHEIDRELKEDLVKKQGSSNYKRMQEFRRKLPSWEKRDELLHLIENNQVVVISGETGELVLFQSVVLFCLSIKGFVLLVEN